MRFSALMSSSMIMEPRVPPSGLKSGRKVALTEMVSSPTAISASISTSEPWPSPSFARRSMIQPLGPVKNAAASVPTMPSCATFRMRNPAALQVAIRPSSSRVMTPFDILSSMASL